MQNNLEVFIINLSRGYIGTILLCTYTVPSVVYSPITHHLTPGSPKYGFSVICYNSDVTGHRCQLQIAFFQFQYVRFVKVSRSLVVTIHHTTYCMSDKLPALRRPLTLYKTAIPLCNGK